MKTQTMEFATVVKNGVVQQVGKSFVIVPNVNFKGETTNWYVDKPKKADK